MSPLKIAQKTNSYADNLEHFSELGLLSSDSTIKEFCIGSMVGEIAYSPSGWCDVLSSGLKTHYFSLGSVQSITGHKIYNFTLWKVSIIFGFLKGDK